jgi:CRISPR system Cascade subunit CasE
MSLHMLHLPIRQRQLLACGREHGLVTDTNAVDLGYLVHALLKRALGNRAPRPFDIQTGTAAGQLPVIAYGDDDAATLRQRAATSGDAPAQTAIDWDKASSKPMPLFAAGHRLGFRVRVCPILRVGKRHPRFAPGAEVDPYLALIARGVAEHAAARPGVDEAALKREAVDAAPPREAVYGAWLADRIGPAARLADARLVSLRDARLWRRGKPGDGAAAAMHGHQRPSLGSRAAIGRREAVFEGNLEVADDALFRQLLARGVGRHRAFGFGMLLLRPSDAG